MLGYIASYKLYSAKGLESVTVNRITAPQARHADFLPLISFKTSSGSIGTSCRAHRSNFSRFSIIQRASIAAAYCSAHINISSLMPFPKLAASASELSSNSCNEKLDDSSKKSNGGRPGERIGNPSCSDAKDTMHERYLRAA